MTFYSFEYLLRIALNTFKEPDPRILEWGPGFSTGIMLEEKINADIWAIEHDPEWFKAYSKKFKSYLNVHIYHRELDKDYHKLPLLWAETDGLFDLIMIDGRNRVLCCHTAVKVLKDNGVVILHDADRHEYREGVALFRVAQNHDDTVLMVKK